MVKSFVFDFVVLVSCDCVKSNSSIFLFFSWISKFNPFICCIYISFSFVKLINCSFISIYCWYFLLSSISFSCMLWLIWFNFSFKISSFDWFAEFNNLILSTLSFFSCSSNLDKYALSLCFWRNSLVNSILLSVSFSFFCVYIFNSRSRNNSFDFNSEFVFSKIFNLSLLELRLILYSLIVLFKLFILWFILFLLKIFSADNISSICITFSSWLSLNLDISWFFCIITIFIWLKKVFFINTVSDINFL